LGFFTTGIGEDDGVGVGGLAELDAAGVEGAGVEGAGVAVAAVGSWDSAVGVEASLVW
jgi:hypothetical protein